jgi:hypothetical protein
MKINKLLSTTLLTTLSVSTIVYASFLNSASAAPREIRISNITEQLAPSRLIRGDHIHIVTSLGDDRTELVKLFAIVGDTGGLDISDDDNPKNDTRIVAIEFNPVRIELQ